MTPLPPDTLNSVGVLTRREIEARLLAPLIAALSAEFGEQAVLAVVRQTILTLARQQGAALAASLPVNDLQHFAQAMQAWNTGDALEQVILEQSDQRLSYDIHRCSYAEMYQRLGIPELGSLLSCNRDFALIEGYNPDIRLTRTQTIMEGAPTCDFCYELAR